MAEDYRQCSVVLTRVNVEFSEGSKIGFLNGYNEQNTCMKFGYVISFPFHFGNMNFGALIAFKVPSPVMITDLLCHNFFFLENFSQSCLKRGKDSNSDAIR